MRAGLGWRRKALGRAWQTPSIREWSDKLYFTVTPLRCGGSVPYTNNMSLVGSSFLLEVCVLRYDSKTRQSSWGTIIPGWPLG
jgi:hypothetical protein